MTEGQTQTVPTPAPVAQPAPVAPASAQAAATAPVAPALPQDTRDRTREQFDKLLESNKRLFETNEALRKEIGQRQASAQTFAPIQNAQPTPTPQVNRDEFTVIDPVSGEKYIDDQRLQARLAELRDKASRAEQTIQSYIKTTENREIDRQNREAFAAHPDLNPSDKSFDPTFHKQVRGIILDSMYNPDEYGGRPLGFKDAGDLARTLYPKKATSVAPVAQTDDEKKRAAAAAQALKEQGSAQVQSQPQNAPQPTYDADLLNLRNKTRYGDTKALAQRLLNTEHIVKKE